jgi:hypothetical protein
MKARTGLLVGLGVGYVLGTRAGRQRFEQLRKAAGVVANNPPIKRFLDDSRQLSDVTTRKAREQLAEQLHEASSQVREAAS